jgi:interferon-induced GTP-binding protein Mx
VLIDPPTWCWIAAKLINHWNIKMEDNYDEKVRPLLDLIDSLRGIGISSEDGVFLPQIAVMGDQSSGKSSVLEAISGIPFPRGSGLVTRCPTQIVMKRLMSKPGEEESESSGNGWTGHVSIAWSSSPSAEQVQSLNDCYAKHRRLNSDEVVSVGAAAAGADAMNGISVATTTQLTAIIEELTNVLTAGDTSDFSTNCICITVSSRTSPDLTLIDLPGIIRTTTAGQKNVSIIAQVNDLINSYMVQMNTIILAVLPSNQDIATIDILERASQIDPAGLRTIGVLTKPDLVGEGGEREVVDVLNNLRKPLRLGYVMIKNPSQKQINEGIDHARAVSLEKQYFENHEFFGPNSVHIDDAHKNSFGVTNLIQRLTEVLVGKIRSSLPSLKSDLQIQTTHTKQELAVLASSTVPNEPREQQTVIMKQLSSYMKVLQSSHKGEYREYPLNDSSGPDVHAVRMLACNQAIFLRLQSDIQKLRPLGIQNIDMANKIQNKMASLQGRELPGFLNTQVFYSEIVECIELWKPLIEKCKADVINTTLNIACQLLHVVMCANTHNKSSINQFPELYTNINSIILKLVEATSDEVSTKLEELVNRELLDPLINVNNTTQGAMLEIVNGIRQRTFENALREILDTLDAPSTDPDAPAVTMKDICDVQELVRYKVGCWYMSRHGINTVVADNGDGTKNTMASGSVFEMITLIQAYWDVSSKRIVDNICMCIETEFVNKLLLELETQCIFYGVSLSVAELSVLCRENPENTRRKMRLTEKLAKLEKAEEIFKKFDALY